MRRVGNLIGGTVLLALWVAATIGLGLWCESMQPPCDPQTSVDRCEPELGNPSR